jgi:hypothetical protein
MSYCVFLQYINWTYILNIVSCFLAAYCNANIVGHIFITFYITGSGARQPRDRSSSPGEIKNVRFSVSSIPTVGSSQPLQWLPGALSSEIKRVEYEVDHSCPSSAEIK